MHIIALLGAIITILFYLDRLGVDLGWFNPWSWRRRRAWAKKYEGDPIYSVEDPIHVAAILIIGVAKLDGDLSAEQKQTVLNMFEEKFSLSPTAANELLTASTHLFGAPQVIGTQLNGVADKHKGSFSPDQAESMLDMLDTFATSSGEPTARQREYAADMRERFGAPRQEGTWA